MVQDFVAGAHARVEERDKEQGILDVGDCIFGVYGALGNVILCVCHYVVPTGI